MEKIETRENEPNYESVRKELEAFLLTVGKKVLDLRNSAEADSNFTQLKADRTIVTKADGLAEDLIRAWIGERFPADTILGEEREQKIGGVRSWLVDPIDGTYNYNDFGNKFGVSVGLVENNDPKLGVIFYPAEGVTLSATDGAGAWINGAVFKTSKGATDLAKAKLIAQVPEIVSEYFKAPRFQKTIEQQASLLIGRNQEGYLSFTFSFLQFLQGDEDALLHFGASSYDIGAIATIAKELKLEMSGYDGDPINFNQETISIVISKNPKLHKAIIKSLNRRG